MMLLSSCQLRLSLLTENPSGRCKPGEGQLCVGVARCAAFRCGEVVRGSYTRSGSHAARPAASWVLAAGQLRMDVNLLSLSGHARTIRGAARYFRTLPFRIELLQLHPPGGRSMQGTLPRPPLMNRGCDQSRLLLAETAPSACL